MNPRKFPDPEALARRIAQGERAAVASGLNLLDNALPEARARAAALLTALAALAGRKWLNEGHIIGITGPPGAGKSSLMSALIREWRSDGHSVAVLAVDPSSRPELGGGALLGDRIRIKSTLHDEGVFIRSLASRNQLGGVAIEVWPMSWLLLSCFDRVIVETVGVGQTEIDIAEIGDTVCYVAQPASGDTIQYLKSGIMEIPDVFAVNKADLGEAARKTAAEIGRSAHASTRPDRQSGWDYPVSLVSATQNQGIRPLLDHFDRHRQFLLDAEMLASLRGSHQRGWIVRLLKEEFGLFGITLAGGRAAIDKQLVDNGANYFAAYENTREKILSRFTK